MISRFKDNKPRLIQALQKQKLINGNETLATEIAEKTEILEYKVNEPIIIQDNTDEDVFFILTGRVAITVNNREMAIRESGIHIGEMALINPELPRSASAVAMENTVVAKITSPDLADILNNYPLVWRKIAENIAERLVQRNKLVTVPNPRPTVFIGSSKEGLAIARAIQTSFQHDDFKAVIWSTGVFGATHFTMDDLEHTINSSDFAILVISPDDHVISREKEFEAPRDNVIFELGLAMGALSRIRTFIAKPRRTEIKIPSDLLGINPVEYTVGDADDLATNVAPMCNEIRDIINKLGPK